MKVTSGEPMTDQPPQPISLGGLKAICRKGGAHSQGDPFWFARYVYRPISIYITWLCVKLGLSANAVTLLSGICLLTGAILFGLPSPYLWLVGAALAQLYVILDHVDGELARYERVHLGKSSGMAGVFYDSCCHPGENAIAVAISLRLFVTLDSPWWVLVAIVVMLFPGAIAPWQRYCEAVVVWASRQATDGDPRLPAHMLRTSSLTVGTDEQAAARPGLKRIVLSVLSQTIGWSGQQVLLPIFTIMDFIDAVPTITIGRHVIPWLALWVLLRAATHVLAAVKSTLAYGRRLQSLQ